MAVRRHTSRLWAALIVTALAAAGTVAVAAPAAALPGSMVVTSNLETTSSPTMHTDMPLRVSMGGVTFSPTVGTLTVHDGNDLIAEKDAVWSAHSNALEIVVDGAHLTRDRMELRVTYTRSITEAEETFVLDLEHPRVASQLSFAPHVTQVTGTKIVGGLAVACTFDDVAPDATCTPKSTLLQLPTYSTVSAAVSASFVPVRRADGEVQRVAASHPKIEDYSAHLIDIGLHNFPDILKTVGRKRLDATGNATISWQTGTILAFAQLSMRIEHDDPDVFQSNPVNPWTKDAIFPYVVAPRETTLDVAVSNLAPAVGDTATLTVGTRAGADSCGDTITVLRGTTVVDTQTIGGGRPCATATVTVPVTAPHGPSSEPLLGPDALTVRYTSTLAGSFSGLIATDQTVTVNWRPVATTTELSVSPLNPTTMQDVTATATVTQGAAGSAVSGTTVRFVVATTAGGTVATLTGHTDAAGIATVRVPALAADDYRITATAAAPNSFTSGSSDTATLSTVRVPSALELSTPASTPAGSSATATATITSDAPAPGGSVTFLVDGVAVDVVPVTNGAASTTLDTSALGTQAITAEYGGDDRVSGSTASASTTVTALPIDVTLSAADASLHPGQTLIATATACAPETNGAIPSGTAIFTLGATQVATVDGVLTDGCLEFVTTVPVTELGAFDLEVAVALDAPFESGAAALRAEQGIWVTPWTSVVTGSLSASEVDQGAPAVFDVSVTATDALINTGALFAGASGTAGTHGIPVATGTVTLLVDGIATGAPVALHQGNAALPLPTSTVGEFTIGARYTPDTTAVAPSEIHASGAVTFAVVRPTVTPAPTTPASKPALATTGTPEGAVGSTAMFAMLLLVAGAALTARRRSAR